MESDKAEGEGREFALLWLSGMASWSVPIEEEITLPHLGCLKRTSSAALWPCLEEQGLF